MNSYERDGYLHGFAAYALWGAFPLYFVLFARSPAVEVTAHRVVWSLVTCLLILVSARQLGQFRAALLDGRLRRFLTAAGALIAANWTIYIYGVGTGRTLDAALGYFINPLATTALGVIVLRERLRPGQRLAVGLSSIAVIVLLVGYGQVPWIALGLAGTFATYSLVKKVAGRSIAPTPGMTVETAVLAPLAVGYLLFLGATGQASAPVLSWYTVLLLSTGLVTAVPLLLFASAAARIPLVAVGLLQYLAPVSQFLLGWLVFHEPMPLARWVGFILVWAAIMLFIADAVQAAAKGHAR